MHDEKKIEEKAINALNFFTAQYHKSYPGSEKLKLMSVDEIAEWILNNTGYDFSFYLLNEMLADLEYTKQSTSGTIFWMVELV